MLAAALIGGVSALVAPKATDPICGVTCIDGVDDCGQPYKLYAISLFFFSFLI